MVLHRAAIPRQSVLRKASICSCPTPLAPFCPNSRWESSRCKTSIAMSWKPPSWFPPRSASTYDRRRSGSFCLMNCAAEAQTKTADLDNNENFCTAIKTFSLLPKHYKSLLLLMRRLNQHAMAFLLPTILPYMCKCQVCPSTSWTNLL